MLRPRPARRIAVERLLALAPRRPGRGRRRPSQARPQFDGNDLARSTVEVCVPMTLAVAAPLGRPHRHGLTGEAQVGIWRLLGAVLAVSVMLGGLLLVTAGPAAACTCARGVSEAQVAASADAVFVGTLVGSRVDPSVLTREYRQREEQRIKELKERFGPPTAPAGELDPVVLTFAVSRVYKGTVGKRQEIVIPPGATGGFGDTCQFYVPATPGPWLLFASKSSGDSTLQLDPGQYVSGFMRLCSGGSRALAAGGEPGFGGRPARASRGPVSSPSQASLVVGVGVLAAGVAAGLGLAIRRARRRASAD